MDSLSDESLVHPFTVVVIAILRCFWWKVPVTLPFTPAENLGSRETNLKKSRDRDWTEMSPPSSRSVTKDPHPRTSELHTSSRVIGTFLRYPTCPSDCSFGTESHHWTVETPVCRPLTTAVLDLSPPGSHQRTTDGVIGGPVSSDRKPTRFTPIDSTLHGIHILSVS